MNHQLVIETTRRWISSIVIGLNLCPFAQRVFDAGRIRYVVTEIDDASALLDLLGSELKILVSSPISEIETTLLIHPHVLQNFLDYNDFLDDIDRLLRRSGLRGTIQIAGFHPHYQFAGTDPDAVENYTNRSPYPMLHLLREESISQVAGDPEALLDIPERNIETLRALGKAKLLGLLNAITM